MERNLMLLSFNNEILPVEFELFNYKKILRPNPNNLRAITEDIRKDRPCMVILDQSIGDEDKVIEISEIIDEAATDFGIKLTICLFAEEIIIHPKISWVKNIKELEGLWKIL